MGANAADKQLRAARAIFEHLAERLDTPFTLRLWDGSTVPLGAAADPRFVISIKSAGVLGSLMRRPTVTTLIRHYACGNIAVEGADLIALVELARAKRVRLRGRDLSKRVLLRNALPLLLARQEPAEVAHEFAGRKDPARRDDKNFIQFHYDVGNDFYALFLDPQMQYSCAYFTDWNNSLEQAHHDKLDMICRKLRLQPGERFLDIGCGWGGLLCHAAANYGVEAHGVTLSQAQHDFARDKVRRLGLQAKVRIDLMSYERLDGEYDKIASIGMYEHVGLANYPRYFDTLNGLLRDRGLLLNHGITRRAKRTKREARHVNRDTRLIHKYIFPGSELDHIGYTLTVMEARGFKIRDVEG